ncbi:MAG: NADH-quinone oxidoreductase subunit NuoG [Gammaproteobacteria bacterium]|nr:NADH-quinone oxidoreductase subunit NuoG [Gammaproteobacteria bacterium]
MVKIEIDGKEVVARDGAMLIEAADEAGIYIPRFCYHKKLSVAANCRMCLVEVEKARKPLPACATPVTDGMRVATKSPGALAAQKGVMEFLLINHPLDCPICDQGGECELQDVAVGYGKDVSRYSESKRVLGDKNIGPLISTDMTRCIHCTRCVRFCDEIAGSKELGGMGRGEHMSIGTYVAATVDSELSGNIIDLCPVGALTSKPFRYKARAWEMFSRDGVAGHDSVGSNLTAHTRGNEILRVVPADNEAVNETWLSDRDRFAYTGIESKERLTSPMVKQGGSWKQVDWETALRVAAEALQRVSGVDGPHLLGTLVSPSSTTEEIYLAQKITRGLLSDNIDYRLRQRDFSDVQADPVCPTLGVAIADIEKADALLFIGANIRKDQPLLGLRTRKAAKAGAHVSFINSMAYDFNFPVANNIAVKPSEMLVQLAAVAKACAANASSKVAGLDALTAGVTVGESHKKIAEALLKGERAHVILGVHAMAHADYAALRALAKAIADMTGATFGYATAGANAAGASMVGAVPHRATAVKAGMNVSEMLNAKMKAMLLLNVEPEFDCADTQAALQGMKNTDFVIALTPFRSASMDSYADVLLPIATYAETAGSFVNGEGRWQLFEGVCAPKGEARPAWKVLRVLGNLLDLNGFDYFSVEEIHDELRAKVGEPVSATGAVAMPKSLPSDVALERVADVPMYAIDNIIRRAAPLQKTADAMQAAVYLNAETAAKFAVTEDDHVAVTQGQAKVTLPLIIDARVPAGVVYVPSSLAGTIALGNAQGTISIAKASAVANNEKVSAGNA